MCQIQITAAIQTIHERLIGRVSTFVPEAHKVEWYGGSQFKPAVFLHPVRELLRELHMSPYVMLQAFNSVVANHEP